MIEAAAWRVCKMRDRALKSGPQNFFVSVSRDARGVVSLRLVGHVIPVLILLILFILVVGLGAILVLTGLVALSQARAELA